MMKFDPFRYSSAFGGVRIIESEHATALPTAKPRTLDMQEMVDHFHKLGLVQRRPVAFETPQGLVVHPSIADKLRKRAAESVSRYTDSLMMDALRGRP